MRQRGIMRRLPCYWVPESIRTRVCEIYIVSRKLEAIPLNHQQEKWQKESIMWIKNISFICDLLIFSSRSFSYEFGNLLNYFWGNDLSFFSLLITLIGHFNLSILIISSHCKWVFNECQKCGGILCCSVWGKWDIRIFIRWRI